MAVPSASAPKKKTGLEWARKPDVPCSRHLVPPFVNNLSLDWVLHRGMVKCRCARLLQMCLPKDVLREALRHEVPVWRRSGYDTRLIVQLWSWLWKYPSMEKYARAYAAGYCLTKEEKSLTYLLFFCFVIEPVGCVPAVENGPMPYTCRA